MEEALNNPNYAQQLAQWVQENSRHALAPIVYATVLPEKLHEIQRQFGGDNASHAIEQVFAQLAVKLKGAGFTNFITAGGETSGIVVQQLSFSGFPYW